MTKPIVAIVGRPNVGKSTLFNRLVGKRVAIVEDLPGTTRDRVYADASWGSLEFTLVDTGGLEVNPGSDISQKVRGQIELALQEADVIIFLADVKDGVLPDDVEIANRLRRSGKPVILAVNKVDNEQRQNEAVQFYELALEEPVAISAYHGIGIDDLMGRVLENLPPVSEVAEAGEMLKVAIVGRTNVGKSMLLNAILGQERAIVSEVPGTTRDAIDTVFRYDGESMLLIDTAGIRRRGKIEGGIERYSVLRALRAIDRADVVFLVLDATEAVTAQDTHIAGYIWEALKGMVVVLNKWDLARVKNLEASEIVREVRERLKFQPDVPIVLVSAKYGEGIEGVLESVKRVGQERLKRPPTHLVNEVINEAVFHHGPPHGRGQRLKILYVTQADVNPPTFVFSVNNAGLLHFSYRRYLENRLRRAFGFHGTPIHLVFKSRGEG